MAATVTNVRVPWSEAELEFLRESSKTMSSREAAGKLGRTHTAVKNICSRRGIKFMVREGPIAGRSRVWTKTEETILLGLSERHSIEQAARRLHRSYKSVCNKIDELGISFKRNRLTLTDLAEILGISSRTVYVRRDKLGLEFRCSSHGKLGRASTRGPTGEDIVALARDILNNPPTKDLPNTSARKLRQVIQDYEGWEG